VDQDRLTDASELDFQLLDLLRLEKGAHFSFGNAVFANGRPAMFDLTEYNCLLAINQLKELDVFRDAPRAGDGAAERVCRWVTHAEVL
jgi:hypothetical protein